VTEERTYYYGHFFRHYYDAAKQGTKIAVAGTSGDHVNIAPQFKRPFFDIYDTSSPMVELGKPDFPVLGQRVDRIRVLGNNPETHLYAYEVDTHHLPFEGYAGGASVDCGRGLTILIGGPSMVSEELPVRAATATKADCTSKVGTKNARKIAHKRLNELGITITNPKRIEREGPGPLVLSTPDGGQAELNWDYSGKSSAAYVVNKTVVFVHEGRIVNITRLK
jgi:hypothetical protein